MTPAAKHYLWCLIYNMFGLSRGPACNWHINQQINTEAPGRSSVSLSQWLRLFTIHVFSVDCVTHLQLLSKFSLIHKFFYMWCKILGVHIAMHGGYIWLIGWCKVSLLFALTLPTFKPSSDLLQASDAAYDAINQWKSPAELRHTDPDTSHCCSY